MLSCRAVAAAVGFFGNQGLGCRGPTASVEAPLGHLASVAKAVGAGQLQLPPGGPEGHTRSFSRLTSGYQGFAYYPPLLPSRFLLNGVI